MANYVLENEVLSIEIHSHGAELKSLKSKDTKKEYLWCGDAKYWGRTSPILFPFVGGLNHKEFRTNGKTYPMTQHGFARDMEFQLLSQTKDEIWFQLESNQETLEKYPFAFLLKVGYSVDHNHVNVMWQVENPGKEDLPFSIGGHPAFNCPLEKDEEQSECFVGFGDTEELVSTRISESGLATECMDVYGTNGGKLALTENLFDHDALVIENHQTHEVSLCGKDGSAYLTVTMEAPLFGIWSPPGKKAPFVCIEPWYGRCDSEDFEGDLKERKWGNMIKPGEIWKASYQISIQ